MPATSASTTSLTVQPKAFLTVFRSASGTRARPTSRCCVTAPFQGVRGAVSGTAPVSFSGSRRPCTTRATDWAVRPTRGSRFMVRRKREAAA